MKKAIIVCILAIGMMAGAQTTKNQITTKPLQLNSVPAGADNDDILVRGADKVVKSIKRSQFVSPTPTLQQVLDVGNFSRTGILLNGGNANVETENGRLTAWGDASRNTFVGLDGSDTRLIFYRKNIGNISIKSNNIIGSRVIQLPTLIEESDVVLPISVNGNYADLNGNITLPSPTPTLQQVLDTNNTAIGSMINISGDSGSAQMGKTWFFTRDYSGDNNSMLTPKFVRVTDGVTAVRLISTGLNVTNNGVVASYNLPLPLASDTRIIPLSVNNTFADDTGNIPLSSITTTFTTNDGKTVTVTNGVITGIQ